MNPAISVVLAVVASVASVVSLDSLAILDTPNPDKANSEGKLNNYAVTESCTSNVNSSQGLGAAASTSESLEHRAVTNQASTEIVESNETGDGVVSEIIEHMSLLKTILIENDEHYGEEAPSPDIEVFENAIKLLNHLESSNISKGEERNDGLNSCGCCEGYSDTFYDVYYEGDLLFTVIHTASETRFSAPYTAGISGAIKTTDLFNELYFSPDAPGYQSTKSEYEQCLKLQGS